MENGTDYRTLVKAYAIRFDVLVNGNVSLCTLRVPFFWDGDLYDGMRVKRVPESCCPVAGGKVQHDPDPHQHGGSLHLSGSGEFSCDDQ